MNDLTSSTPTFNPRQTRCIQSLLVRPHMREELDRRVGASNSPEVVRKLREKGLELPCELIPKIDRDGKKVLAGRYSLSPPDQDLLKKWGLI